MEYWNCHIFSPFAVSELRLLTNSWVQAECGQTLNLTCEVNSTNPAGLIIKTLEWVHRKATCDYSPAKTDHGLYCHLQNETSPILLLGTLTNITPDDGGEYICKMHSNQGIVNEKTLVKVNCKLELNQIFTFWFDMYLFINAN